MRWWKSLNYRTRVRIGVVILLIGMIDMFGSIGDGQREMESNYEAKIKKLETHLAESEKERVENLEFYKDRLTSIVIQVHSQDYGIGGYDTFEGQELEKLYDSIVGGVSPSSTVTVQV